jgi:hypothetical protein
MGGTIALVITLGVLAIPILIVAKIMRRVREVSGRLSDPTRLQRVFAESAAAALRRAGADPKAVAKLEVIGMGQSGERGAVDLRDALQEARAALRKPDPGEPIPSTTPIPSTAPPRSLFDDALPLPPVARPRAAPRPAPHRTPRPRRPTPVTPIGGFETGDRFRLSEPPEIREARRRMPFDANWLAIAAAIGAAVYYLLR